MSKSNKEQAVNQLGQLAAVIETLHARWQPHAGQLRVGRALFKSNLRRLFIQCGRKWGKSEICMYILLRWSLTHPGSQCFYFAPFQKQAREILWDRLKAFVPQDFVKGAPNETHMKITLKNGSTIKLDGSDNYEAYRGITPGIVVCDEFKDFRPQFYVAMKPNLIPKNAPIVIMGTPPDHDCQYTELAEEFKQNAKAFHTEAPSTENPHNDPDLLKEEMDILTKRGAHDELQREYYGKYVKGGSRSIFPMLSRDLHVVHHEKLRAELSRDLKKLQWFLLTDPGTATCFGALIYALNPYTKQVYILDEIYERRPSETSVSKIWPAMRDKMVEANPHLLPADDEWYRTYDEAASWFCNEMLDRFNVGFAPTQKAANKKENGLSLIKDQLIHNKLMISDRCKWLIWEMENYILDDQGKIPKKNDHLIDCLRYGNATAAYDPNLVQEPVPLSEDRERRGFTPEQDIEAELGPSSPYEVDDY